MTHFILGYSADPTSRNISSQNRVVMNHQIGVTKNGKIVEINFGVSLATKKISRDPRLLTLAKEALGQIKPHGDIFTVTHDMKRAIGYDFIIDIIDAESVFYAQVARETTYTPFTKKGSPKSTSLLTIVLESSASGDSYVLNNIWLGPTRPPLPGDAREDEDSKLYWQSHAYILGDQTIKSSSVTKAYPSMNR